MVERQKASEFQAAFQENSPKRPRFIFVIDKETGRQKIWDVEAERTTTVKNLMSSDHSCSTAKEITEVLELGGPQVISLRRKRTDYWEFMEQVRELVEKHNQKEKVEPITLLRMRYRKKVGEGDRQRVYWTSKDIVLNESVDQFRSLILTNRDQIETALIQIGVVTPNVFKRAREGDQRAKEAVQTVTEEIAEELWQVSLRRFRIDSSTEPAEKIESAFNVLLDRLRSRIIEEETEKAPYFEATNDLRRYVASACSNAAHNYRRTKENFNKRLKEIFGEPLAFELKECQCDLNKASLALKHFFLWLPPSLELTLREAIKGEMWRKHVAKAIERFMGRKIYGLTGEAGVEESFKLIKTYAAKILTLEERNEVWRWPNPPQLRWSKDLPVIANLNPRRFERILTEFMELPGSTVNQREALRLLGEGMSNKEIALVLGKSEGAVKILFHRAYKRLNHIYRERGYFAVFED
jgi:DNA-binding CsgD family transcriptional regulator